jgi:plasmid maintenance system antidote protein VapI
MPRATLKPADVATVRFLHKLGWAKRGIAEIFGVDDETIREVVKGQSGQPAEEIQDPE